MCQSGRFETQDGLVLFAHRWEPPGDSRAHLVLLHGYCEHAGRYGHVAQALNAMGIAVYAYDQRGHGKSPGKRGYIRDFDVLLQDLDCFFDHIRAHLDGKPHVVMGHSLGGLVLARYAQTRRLDARALVFSSALLQINDDVSRLLVALADVLGTLTPWLPVASLDSSRIARDRDVVNAYDADPLIYHDKILARSGAQINGAIARARADVEAISAPVYIIHGADDRLVPVDGSRLLHDRCGSNDKTLVIYEGGYHELLNDLEKETVIANLCAWLDARVETP